ncbi:MAG TPA: lipopolysaccharide heptosyltransferase II [Chloroflexota bacterium]|nr:lipopolysaccharide heptosyltransferase II [Chloroflexota bacterium]
MVSVPRRADVRRSIHRALYVGIGAAGYVARRVRPPHPRPVRSVLIVRVDLLGDVLFSRQAAQAVRAGYPDAHVTLLTLPYTEPLAAGFDEVDEIIAIDTNRIRTFRGLISPATWRTYHDAYRQIRRRRFDLAISLAGRTGSLLAALSGAPRVIGYQREAFPATLTEPVPGGRYGVRRHEVEYVRGLAGAAGGVPPDRILRPVIPADAVARAARLLASAGIRDDARVVVIHAGAVNGSAKRWPARSWAAFADALTARGYAPVLVGSASDKAIADEVRRHSRTNVVSLAGGTDILDLLALLSRADLVASGDSGPLHLAVALARPVVAVYGPTDPAVHGPYYPDAPASLHRADLPCSPCYSMAATAECPLGDPICMRLVAVDTMVQSALQILEGNPRQAGTLR